MSQLNNYVDNKALDSSGAFFCTDYDSIGIMINQNPRNRIIIRE